MSVKPRLVHELVEFTAKQSPNLIALRYQLASLTYADLWSQIEAMAGNLTINKGERVALYTEKCLPYVVAMYAVSAAGGVYVPINPALKAEQVAHILNDCGVVKVLTTKARAKSLESILPNCTSVQNCISIDDEATWSGLINKGMLVKNSVIDQDIAAILYTSGSTGKPKGVVLSHRNIVQGAVSVAEYLHTKSSDKILAVLPLSFDYGMNQLTQAALVGAEVVLINHLFAQDIVKACATHGITCLAGVPPLWLQLSALEWPAAAYEHLRLITNSGGHMPRTCLQILRSKLPNAKPYLMYGLTEAFRSTYLPPEEIDRRVDSMGRAIPNAEILVLKPDGSPCAPGEVGELVHRGVHVALGYWNDPEKTAARYKPLPRQPHQSGLVFDELAVWSGDLVKADEDGYLYYVSRNDEQIKVSGYRVSPGEVEEVLYSVPGLVEAIATGSKHPKLGEAIIVVAYVDETYLAKSIEKTCASRLPAWMQPSLVNVQMQALPRNPNGKIDRSSLKQNYANYFLDKE